MNPPTVLSVRIKNDKEGPQTGDVVLNGSSINEWHSDADYSAGEVVVFNGQFYQALEDNKSTEDFDYTKWQQIGIPDLIVENFKPNFHYRTNQLIAVDGTLYRAREDFTSKKKFYPEDWESLEGTNYTLTSEDKSVAMTFHGMTVDFSVAPYVDSVRSALTKQIDTKVDAVEGKELSSNDFTDDDRQKLHRLLEIVRLGSNLSLDEDGVLSAELNVVFDASLDPESTNGLQNKVITSELSDLKAQDNELSNRIKANAEGIAANHSTLTEQQEELEVLQDTTKTLGEELTKKVDAVEGKELSSNDFTDEDQTKLNRLQGIYSIGDHLELSEDGVLSAEDMRTKLLSSTGGSHKEGMTQAAITEALLSTKQEISDSLSNVATSGSYEDLLDKPTGERLTLKANDNVIGQFNTLTGEDQEFTLTIPTKAEDIGALASSTPIAQELRFTLDPETYTLSLQLLDQAGHDLGDAVTVDLPLEDSVTNLSYNNEDQSLLVTTRSGSTTSVSLSELIAELATKADLASAVQKLEGKIQTNTDSLTTQAGRLTKAEKQLTTLAEEKLSIANLQAGSNITITPAEEVVTVAANSVETITGSSALATDKAVKAYADNVRSQLTTIIETLDADAVGALPASTKVAADLSFTMDNESFVLTVQLLDSNGEKLGSAHSVDLPLESVVVSGRYDKESQEVVLTLKDGSEVKFSVADLVSGLQTEITPEAPLSADLVTPTTNKTFVTAEERKQWNAAVEQANSNKTIIDSNSTELENLTTKLTELGNTKQDKLTAGKNITITKNTISATDTTYTAGTGLSLKGTEFSVDPALIPNSDTVDDKISEALKTYATKTELTTGLDKKQNALKAGANIKIDAETNTISATDTNTTYSAGEGLNLKGTEFSVDTETVANSSAVNDKLTTTLASYATKTELQSGLSGKQNSLKAGNNIKIDAVTNTISATDTNTTYTAGDGLKLTENSFSVADTVARKTDLTPLATNEQLTSQLSKKQDKLIAGKNITIAEDGKTISADADPYTLPAATTDKLGGIKVGEGLAVTEDGVLSTVAKPIEIDEYTDEEWVGLGF